MIERRLDDYAHELGRFGVRGRAADRVLAEARDHLLELAQVHGEAEALARFGDPRELARTIAAQLATTRTRRATHVSFAALVVAGAGYLGFLAAIELGGGAPDIFDGRSALLGVLAGVATFLFPQVAFVAGCLALVRSWRLRHGRSLPADELRVMRSRAAIGLGAGALTLAAWALYAVEFWNARPLESWVAPTIAAGCGLLMLPLCAGSVALTRAGRPQAVPGPGGDVFEDFAPLFRFRPLGALTAHPWLFAALFALGVALAGFVLGWVAEGDPGSGIVRGGFEGVAVLVCFAALGRRLALRQ